MPDNTRCEEKVTVMADRTPDECVTKVWEIARGNPDPCDPVFDACTDQWWGVWITCPHGRFKGESLSLTEVSTAFRGAMSNYWRAHPDSTGAQA